MSSARLRPWGRAAVWAATASCLSATAGADPFADFLRGVTIRVPPSADFIKTLQAVAAPSDIPVKGGDDLRAILVAHCGDTAKDVAERAKALNKDLISPDWKAKADGVFHQPPCLKTYKDATIPVPFGSSPDQEIARVTGSTDAKTRHDVIEQNPQVQGSAQDPQPANRTLTYPTVPAFTTVQLPRGANEAAAIEKLLRAASATGAAADVAAAARLSLIRPVTDTDVSSNAACAQPPAADAWPFSLLDLLRALVELRVHGFKVIAPTLVVVADTGMPREVAGFPTAVIDKGNPFAPHPQDGNALAFDGDPDAGHGTVVASLILGGSAFLAVDAVPETRITLRMVNVERKIILPNTTGGPPITHFDVEEARVANAVTQVPGRPPDIFNISLESDAPILTVEQQIRNSANLLVISAAGNSGDDLGAHPHYPAALGGESGPLALQVITVSAHDPSGRLLARSNYGRRYSDIAAPGCGVPAIGSDGQIGRFNGTSVAAPLVTFTSMLLHGYGLTDPRAIKERILDSADVTAELEQKVVSGGRLNVAKALTLADDVLQESGSGVTRLGTAQLSDPVTICGQSIAVRDLRKLSTLPNVGRPGSYKATIVYLDALAHRVPAHCDDPQLTLMFKENGDNQFKPYALSQIQDFVPAQRSNSPQ